MKKVLITGKNSYIGNSFEKWLMKEPEDYQVCKISMRDELWKEESFSQYDVVFHVAGIAHVNENSINQDLYYKVNRDLAYETAKKSKEDGVKQFIFLSSMSVYGLDNGLIDENTSTEPKSVYGKSKFEAEELLKELSDSLFSIAIIRPPMVYGRGCKGNYSKLSRLAVRTPFFVNVENKRSMIYIDNLSEFLKHIIQNCCNGIFFPQNAEYVNTSEMVRTISEYHEKKIIMTRLFNPLIKLLDINLINKMFNDLIYDFDLSSFDFEYTVCEFKESISNSEELK